MPDSATRARGEFAAAELPTGTQTKVMIARDRMVVDVGGAPVSRQLGIARD
jgi:hypothetical protein